jgi:hypothetical protein
MNVQILDQVSAEKIRSDIEFKALYEKLRSIFED